MSDLKFWFLFAAIVAAGVFLQIRLNPTPPPLKQTALCEIRLTPDTQTNKAIIFWLGPMDWVPCWWLHQTKDI